VNHERERKAPLKLVSLKGLRYGGYGYGMRKINRIANKNGRMTDWEKW